jgi:hypothetical protein
MLSARYENKIEESERSIHVAHYCDSDFGEINFKNCAFFAESSFKSHTVCF